MRKARQRAIHLAFRLAHGRAPNRTRWATRGLQHGYYNSEWRRVKKAVVRARRAGLPIGAAMAAAVGR